VAAYDRLSVTDASFLIAETPSTPTHVAAVQVLERGELGTEDGGIDFESIKKATAAVLHRIPRYRQRIEWTPLIGHPVWVDDPHFNLDYHVRHTSLPKPGSIAQLKRLSARIMAQNLDRARPLWELWVVEGLCEDRFATIHKIHHCMIDGMAGMDLMQILFSTRAERVIPEMPKYHPRPAPSAVRLLRDESLRRAMLPLRALRGIRALRRETGDLREEIRVRARALGGFLGSSVTPSSESPINGEVGPHRRLDWLSMPLDAVKRVRKAAGCTVNDVVLASVSGALREYLADRGADPPSLDFRVSAPVSVRREAERGAMGNRVSSWIVRLPLGERRPAARLEAIARLTRELKQSQQAMAVEMMMQVAEWTPPILLSLGARAATGPINSIVTNVPGPQFPLYLLGSRLLEIYPVVPLLATTGLCFALSSYDGRLFWGFNADYDLVPDLERIPALVEKSFLELAAEVGVDFGDA
jgi:diacylglycerol O-acyltransferase